jgi:hypothetical protein
MRHGYALRMLLMATCTAATLSACSKSGAPATANSAPASNPQAAKDLVAYEGLVQTQSWEFAANIGRELLRKYPNSAEAARVRLTFDDVDAKAKAIVEQRRLVALWDYQQGVQSGGKQSSASIYSREDRGSGAEPVRLILRRHSDWGQSVYLFVGGQGFDCPGDCRVSMRFDDVAETWAGEIPETGEPAMFIKDDKAFLARLPKTRVISIDTKVKGVGPRTLVYEVGGYDGTKFLPLPK